MKTTRWIKVLAMVTLPMLCLTLGVGAKRHKAVVRATLGDGQVLYGDVKTSKLSLESSLGVLRIPMEDIGEVGPVEGAQLGESEDHVKVFLRDGSELVGKWQEPELAMGIRVGKDDVRVDLPMEQLQRLQTQGSEIWPQGSIYRVRTSHGDDFLVDAKQSRFTLQNDLGEFSPALADCSSVRPIGDPEGDWRIVLATGTVLIGQVKGNQLELTMPMGPDTVTVPLASFVSMEQQSWAYAQNRPAKVNRGRGGRGARASAPQYEGWDDRAEGVITTDSVDSPSQRELMVAPAAVEEQDGFFQRHSLERAKKQAQ